MTLTFRDLIAWQKSKALARDVYLATDEFPKRETYGLAIKLQRAAVSIPSNIAEGKGRDTKKDFRHFLMQARGSLYEVETQLEIAADLGYLSHEKTKQLINGCDEVGRILNGLINSTEQSAATAS